MRETPLYMWHITTLLEAKPDGLPAVKSHKHVSQCLCKTTWQILNFSDFLHNFFWKVHVNVTNLPHLFGIPWSKFISLTWHKKWFDVQIMLFLSTFPSHVLQDFEIVNLYPWFWKSINVVDWIGRLSQDIHLIIGRIDIPKFG